MPNNPPKGKECKTCDYENAVRHGRADYRCPKCGRQLMLELLFLHEVLTLINSKKTE